MEAKLWGLLLGLAMVGPTWAQHSEPPSFASLLDAPAEEQLTWAARFEHGEGVSQDIIRAVRLYCSAASQGNVAAQYQLGWLYANGRGLPRDDVLAAAWFRAAAAQNDAHAIRMLALMDAPADDTTEPRCMAPGETGGTQEIGPPEPQRQQIEDWVHQLAPDYELDAALVLAVIEAESAFNPQAVSPKNAMGLMQLIPATAARFGVEDPFDPLQNLHGGMAYLRWLLAFFQGDVSLALAGYNAGEGAVQRFGGIPPYAETRAYVTTIMRRYPKSELLVSLQVEPARLQIPSPTTEAITAPASETTPADGTPLASQSLDPATDVDAIE